MHWLCCQVIHSTPQLILSESSRDSSIQVRVHSHQNRNRHRHSLKVSKHHPIQHRIYDFVCCIRSGFVKNYFKGIDQKKENKDWDFPKVNCFSFSFLRMNIDLLLFIFGCPNIFQRLHLILYLSSIFMFSMRNCLKTNFLLIGWFLSWVKGNNKTIEFLEGIKQNVKNLWCYLENFIISLKFDLFNCVKGMISRIIKRSVHG